MCKISTTTDGWFKDIYHFGEVTHVFIILKVSLKNEKYCLHVWKHHFLFRWYKVQSRNQCSDCWMKISKLALFQWKNKTSWNPMLQLKGTEDEITVGIKLTLFFTEKGSMSLIISEIWSIFGSMTYRCVKTQHILKWQFFVWKYCNIIAICFLCQYNYKTLDHWERFHSNPKKICLKNQYQRLVCWYSILQQI